MNRIAALFSVLALGLTVGCAHYHVGSVGHPQLQTVAIAKVTNQTTEPHLGPLTQSAIQSEFAKDGTLRVTRDAADCTLHTEVTQVSYGDIARERGSSTDQDQEAYVTAVFETQVVVKYWVTIPGRRTPIIGPATAIGRAPFAETPDLDIARRDAFRVAAADAAQQVVVGVAEAW